MCTLFIAWKTRLDYPVIVASNRDEFHQRPSTAAAWQGEARWFGGRDDKDGGSWLGLAKSGRFAAITNYRKPAAEKPQAPSRGGLVTRWLEGESQADFIAHLESSAQQYNGFNLLFGDSDKLFYFASSLENAAVQGLAPGVYGLSNALLDTPWPKVRLGKRRFEGVIEAEELDHEVLSGLMRDTRPAPDESLPETGVPLELERLLSSLFIVSPAYGTRATTVFSLKRDSGNGLKFSFDETCFGPSADVIQTTHKTIAVVPE